jgi:hypothetical protein
MDFLHHVIGLQHCIIAYSRLFDRNEATMDTSSETTLNLLHEELLSGICKLVGLHMIASIASCSKLHGVWQRTVQSIDTIQQPLTAKDIETIKKFKNVSHITLYCTTEDTFPIATAVESIVPALAMLKQVAARTFTAV